MRFDRSDTEEPEVNLTALIDVVFLLLIFFMVSTTFEQTSLLDVSLPASENTPAINDVTEYRVMLSLGGQVGFNGWIGALDQPGLLQQRLQQYLEPRSGQSVVVYADEGVAHGQVVTLLAELSEAGVESVQVATRYNQPTGQPER